METTRHSQMAPPRTEGSKPRLGPWGVYGEAIGNPKSYTGGNPKDSEFLQAAEEFMAAHEDALRELAKH
jgi:hypothetical protein